MADARPGLLIQRLNRGSCTCTPAAGTYSSTRRTLERNGFQPKIRWTSGKLTLFFLRIFQWEKKGIWFGTDCRHADRGKDVAREGERVG